MEWWSPFNVGGSEGSEQDAHPYDVKTSSGVADGDYSNVILLAVVAEHFCVHE
jgi:hypothetical protein